MTEKLVCVSWVYLSLLVFASSPLVRLPLESQNNWHLMDLNLLFKVWLCVLRFIFVLPCSLSLNVLCLILSELNYFVHPRGFVDPRDQDVLAGGPPPHQDVLAGAAPPHHSLFRSCHLSRSDRSHPPAASSLLGLWGWLRGHPLDEDSLVIWSSPCLTIRGIVTRLPPFR